MILALDAGNTQIFGGVFIDGEISLRFRKTSKDASSSDELGIFLRTVLRENNIDPTQIEQVGICSVVPEALYSLSACCKEYFGVTPFVLKAGVKTGLKIKYRNPLEVGSDRIADSIAAVRRYPDENIIVVDLGTATTISAITSAKEFLGGAISPGIKLSMEVLESRTSKLPSVEIVEPKEALGRSTVESIQSGLYFAHVGLIRELTSRLEKECFNGEKARVIGTGGFAYLFEKEQVFDAIIPDLVLEGLHWALRANS